ncbi:MAG: M48 family metalloprotease [Armatimonadota bacterium]|nr:MAG: M48 family metalloprotease [Armatimonadota bacterium]
MKLLDDPTVLKLSSVLVHFIWQGAAAALLALVALAGLRRAKAATRYAALLAVLAVMAACPIVTFVLMSESSQPVSVTVGREPPPATTPVVSKPIPLASARAPAAAALHNLPKIPSPSWRARLTSAWAWGEARLAWVAAAWMIGVFALSLRLLIGWSRIVRSKRRGVLLSEDRWRQTLATLSRGLKVSRPVRLLESAAARVPMVIGWLRPAILLPPSALAGLTPEQLETLIAHELAHIRRSDYLVNMLQTVVETLLFYHPAVWWLSHRIRVEREHCCDDLAVAVCGDAVTYARALAELEQLRCPAPQPALTATHGSLLSRVRRLVGMPATDAGLSRSWVASVVAIGVVTALAVAPLWALVGYGSVKAWPKSWPPKFNAHLHRALEISPFTGGPAEVLYDIHFDSREEFERLWPAVLKVKTAGAPLTLKTFKPIEAHAMAGDFYTKPYLRILVPPSNPPRKLEIVRLPSGEPAEYVRLEEEGWRPLQPGQRAGYCARARTDVVLHVDGTVIDLNRIPLPGNTPIVDEREVAKKPGI